MTEMTYLETTGYFKDTNGVDPDTFSTGGWKNKERNKQIDLHSLHRKCGFYAKTAVVL